MKPRVKTRVAALLEATAWMVGFSVLLGVFMPNFRHLAPNILLPLTIAIAACATNWLGSKPMKAKSNLPALETTASFSLRPDQNHNHSQGGHLTPSQSPIFGQPLHAHTNHFVPEPPTSEKLRQLGGAQFEQVIELIFQDRGFCVHRFGDAVLAGNSDFEGESEVDLIIESTADKYAVQYKHWRKWNVDVRQIREFLGSLTDTRIQKGILICLAGCTVDATAMAEKHGIQILDESAIIEMLVESGLMYDHRVSDLLSDEPKYCSK